MRFGRNWISVTRQGMLGLGLVFLSGCGQDCIEHNRLGDFEYSQGNFKNAVKNYEKALAADPECARVKEKLQEAKSRLE